MWKHSPKAMMLAAGFILGAAVMPSLSGCGTGDQVVRRVIDILGPDGYEVTGTGKKELARFRAVYREMTGDPPGSKQFKHFTDAYKRINVNYVRTVPDSELIDAAIKGVRDLKKGKPETEAKKKQETNTKTKTKTKTKIPESALKDPTKPEDVIEVALDTMLASLDPHSSYLNPDEFRDMQISTRGVFGGLGIEVTMENEVVKVVSPIEETPASRAGLKSGDLITHLNGEPIKGQTLHWAVSRMRGEPGTTILLTISRADLAPFDVSIVRDVIRVRAVRWRVAGKIGYLRVARFNDRTMPGVDEAMDGIQAVLGTGMKGLVLDLRNNPGGLLDQSVHLADAFLDKGRIVSVKGRTEGNGHEFDASYGDKVRGLPMVVLINSGSASASEIVASALQDHGRATVIGQRSFGKGSVQTILPLPEAGALKLTTQLYYAPSGRTIQALGVEPDIHIEPIKKKKKKDEKDKPLRREADLSGAIKAVSAAERRQARSVREADCPAAADFKGDKTDRGLGCALALLRAGSPDKFIAAVRTGAAM